MSRPLNGGASYFPKDIDFYEDDKVRMLRGEFGAKGLYLLDYLLCRIYKDGYFIRWNDDKCSLVSDGAGCGCSPQFVAEVVNGCIRRSIFDKRVYDVFGVLTSAGIQRRFVRMLNQRTKYTFIEEYFLLDINDSEDVPEGILNKLAFKKLTNNENPVINNENPVINNGKTQSIVNKNKVDNSILYNNKYQLIRDAYEAHIGFMDSNTEEVLMAMDTKDVLKAIEKAVEDDRKTPGYVYGILMSMQSAV